jgi:hypothetical protein
MTPMAKGVIRIDLAEDSGAAGALRWDLKKSERHLTASELRRA